MNDLSVLTAIVPCYNEEQYISRCLNALLNQEKAEPFALEVIVVDNGSTDSTQALLQGFGDRIRFLVLPEEPISALRNAGASHSTGEWLAFIDADVEVDPRWLQGFAALINKMPEQGLAPEKVITGSTCTIPPSPSWIEKSWFDQLAARDIGNSHYINSGNLLVSRAFFEKIGGFRPSCRTGEDAQFCRDGIEHGAVILKDAAIKAVHHRYPKNIAQFIKRERWHGLGMAPYLLRPWRGKDALLALYYIGLALLCMAGMLLSAPIFGLLSTFLTLTIAPVFALAVLRSHGRMATVPPLTLLFFIYGWARALAVIDIVLRRK